MTLHFEGKRMLEGGLTRLNCPKQPLEDTAPSVLHLKAATEDSTHSAKQQLQSVCLDNTLAIKSLSIMQITMVCSL